MKYRFIWNLFLNIILMLILYTNYITNSINVMVLSCVLIFFHNIIYLLIPYITNYHYLIGADIFCIFIIITIITLNTLNSNRRSLFASIYILCDYILRSIIQIFHIYYEIDINVIPNINR
jgi:hypothetical protein